MAKYHKLQISKVLSREFFFFGGGGGLILKLRKHYLLKVGGTSIIPLGAYNTFYIFILTQKNNYPNHELTFT